jgi:hypothetical protein
MPVPGDVRAALFFRRTAVARTNLSLPSKRTDQQQVTVRRVPRKQLQPGHSGDIAGRYLVGGGCGNRYSQILQFGARAALLFRTGVPLDYLAQFLNAAVFLA